MAVGDAAGGIIDGAHELALFASIIQTPLPPNFSELISVMIADLFNSHSARWVEKFQTQANHFFQQKAEFSELIDRGSRGAGPGSDSVVDLNDNSQALIDM
ncbi:hypothetical protein PM082_022115 [Marasmius tenuissimus]|nr:hypothetical protein PM082_022115 [Marasmius tenuissimus]